MSVKRSPTLPARQSARIRGDTPPLLTTLLGVNNHLVAPNDNPNNPANTPNNMVNQENNLNPAGRVPAGGAAQAAENPPPLGALGNLEALLRQALTNNIPRLPLPTYAGNDHEDPKKFLSKCEEYFTDSQIPGPLKTQTAARGLIGEAERWWSCYQSLDFNWENFKELLLSRYDSPAIVSRLNAQLFSRKQGEKENAGVFLQQKYLLYQRIREDDPEVTKVASLLELLRSNLRMAIRPSKPETLSALMTKAIEMEYDLVETQNLYKPKKEFADKPADRPAKPSNEHQIPKCWHCPERHMHKDCPVLAQKRNERPPDQGNWRKAPDAPAPAANRQ